ncbi:response regulator transcription factor [Anaerolentibacter hominis]|uniref:response regulator transcription factor n=1 Tax=Anaerolentibacter hominis TaxID=3079009 RepID=UPI0031B83A68
MIKILIIEDNDHLRKMVQVYLKQNGFETFCARNGKEALEIFEHVMVDLAVCDIMMPEMDGFELISQLRENHYTLPILIMTAKDSREDIIKGFRIGTDDYMVKPIDLEEMLMRIRALLRRSNIVNENRLTIGAVTLDEDTLTVTRENRAVVLPQKEFLLLAKLLSYPGKIFTRMQLMDEIWGYDIESEEQTVNVHISRLRDKFQDVPEFSIVTVRGVGYKAEVYR